MKPEEFYVRLADLGFPLTDRQKEQYERYFELLVEWNEKTEQEIQDMIDHGITSFKLYMTYPAMITENG